MPVVLRRTTLFQGSNSCFQVEDFPRCQRDWTANYRVDTAQTLCVDVPLRVWSEICISNDWQPLIETDCLLSSCYYQVKPDTSCLQVHSELKIQCNYWIRFQYRQAFRKLRPRSRRFQAIDSIEPTLRPSKCDLSEGNLVFNV